LDWIQEGSRQISKVAHVDLSQKTPCHCVVRWPTPPLDRLAVCLHLAPLIVIIMVSHFVRSALQQGASHRLRSCTLSIRSIHSGLNQYTSMAPLSLVRHGSSHIHYFSCNNSSQTRPFSTKDKETEKEDAPITPILVYESPFASLTLKLKRVSLTSAAIGIIGLPLLSLFYSGDVPATGQLAVVATAGVTAVGSTALLGYCFTPYVSLLAASLCSLTSSLTTC